MRTVKIIAFWALSWTWGIITTATGALVALALLITGHAPRRFHHLVCFDLGNVGGGFSLGVFVFVPHNASDALKRHEGGHSVQNVFLGVFMPIITVWSFCRYWLRRWQEHRGRGDRLPPYEAIWFEKWATALGAKYYN